MLALPFFILLLVVSVYRTSCVEVWHNMSPGDGGSPYSLVGDPITRLNVASFTFTNTFWFPPLGGLLADFLFHIPECLRIIFNIYLIGTFTVPRKVAFLYTVVASAVIQISPESLIFIFSVAFVIPRFPALHNHDPVFDPIRLRTFQLELYLSC